MIVHAHRTDAFSFSPNCSLSIPFCKEGIACLAMPSKKIRGLSHWEEALSSLDSQSYVLVSHTTNEWKKEEIEAVSCVMNKGAHIVLDVGYLEDHCAGMQRAGVGDMYLFERTFFRPCSLLVSMKSLPWKIVAPFVLKLLMQMREGTELFLDPEMVALPSSMLADLSWGMKRHPLRPSDRVSFIPILRSGIFLHKSDKVEIPVFQELERLQGELKSRSDVSVGFLVEEGVLPLCRFTQNWFFHQALEQKMSIKSFVRMTLSREFHLSLSQVDEWEEDLKEIENIFLAHKGAIPKESSFSAMVETFFENSHIKSR